MSALRAALQAQLACFDDDAFVALANRGLLRRAQKDLEKQDAQLVEEQADFLVLAFGEQRIRFDARGPAHARCSCPAAGVCQHVLAAAIALQRMAGQPEPPPGQPDDTLARLSAQLLAIGVEQLHKHAGRPGYRWAWQVVQDLDLTRDLTVGGEQNIVIGLHHPRITMRYMGGGLDALVADVDSAHLARQQVAAVLAYRRAHGLDNPPPPAAPAKSGALDLGKDHALPAARAQTRHDSRARLLASLVTLLGECVTRGLSHLSPAVQERFATLAVWAQGAELYRLALLLRRIGDHVDALLERAGEADEYRLLDDLALAYGLACALGGSDTPAPHLLGRARSQYDEVGAIELVGLGAYPWRTGSGFVGLTMLFWSQHDRRFYSCSEARPELMRGFHPVARYRAAGPWQGMPSPAAASGALVRLMRAQINEQGRLSSADSVSASVQAIDDVAARLAPCADLAQALQARGAARRSLLAAPAALDDWLVFAPARWLPARFDQARQVLCWTLFDAADLALEVELAYSDLAAAAMDRIEQLAAGEMQAGDLLVLRLRPSAGSLLAEPLSVIRARPQPGQNAVDVLYFDTPPTAPVRPGGQTGAGAARLVAAQDGLDTLQALRNWLRRQAERGVADGRQAQLLAEFQHHLAQLAASGLTALAQPVQQGQPFATTILVANYVCMQYEKLLEERPDTAAEDG